MIGGDYATSKEYRIDSDVIEECRDTDKSRQDGFSCHAWNAVGLEVNHGSFEKIMDRIRIKSPEKTEEKRKAISRQLFIYHT